MTFGMILEKIHETIFALIHGTFLGLIFTVVFWLTKVSKVDLEKRTYPNQGVHKSIQTSLTIFIFALTTTAFLHPIISRIPFDEPAQKVRMSLVFGLFWYVFCENGGQACIQHLILRIILTHHYCIPWNLARFLTYCHDRRLLQQIGGRYRFIHRELLEHFAGMEN